MHPSATSPVAASQSTAAQLSPTQLAQLERRARRFWVSLIVGLLGLQVVIGVGSIFLSIGDPSVATVPNYHQKALDWDATHRARQLTKKLGWQISPMIGLASSVGGQRLVRIAVRDQQNQPVPELNVTAKVYHHARGAAIHSLQFRETDAGYYEATTQLSQAGLWQIQLQLAGKHGLASDVRDVVVE